MAAAPEDLPERTRCGTIALLGAPNAGKSTLVNRLVGAKIAIVSPKVQTTRSRTLGIRCIGRSQLVFLDTPGIFTPKRRLERAMVEAAWSGAESADIDLLVVDAVRGIDADTRRIAETLKTLPARRIAVLNKIDRIERPRLLPLAERLNALGDFARIFMVSALQGDGIAELERDLAENVPEGPWLYPADQLTDVSERVFAAEITRERLFLQLREELPYSVAVETESWQEQDDGSVRIEQTVFCLRESHKPILLGKGGSRIKAVGQSAREEMERAFGRRVHLFLHVKVRENWTEDPARYRALGLDFPKDG